MLSQKLRRFFDFAAVTLTLALIFAGPAPALAEGDYPYEGVIEIDSAHDFDTLWANLESAIKDADMLLLYKASASRGAAGRGIDIPGNGVFGVYRNDFAVRMLESSVPAGLEAPLIFYLTEQPDGTTRLTYRQPSAVFGAYDAGDELADMARELDEIFATIAEQATAG
ncbi:MAG: DUF302 domain-containing protein [Pseudomonadota bacterium]